MGKYGQWFNRNETWANQAKPWVSYLARNSYMLQQGRFAADILYFYGQDTNLTALYRYRAPNLPPGYDFDYVDADALIHVLGVNREGEITTPGKVTYRILGLNPNSQSMSLGVLRAIHTLVMEGATIAGPKPTNDPSLATTRRNFMRSPTRSSVMAQACTMSARASCMRTRRLPRLSEPCMTSPDFDYTSLQPGASLEFIHRKLAHGEIYLVDNRGDHQVTVEASFRVVGRVPNLWHADTGKVEPVTYRILNGQTTVPLELRPMGVGLRGLP